MWESSHRRKLIFAHPPKRPKNRCVELSLDIALGTWIPMHLCGKLGIIFSWLDFNKKSAFYVRPCFKIQWFHILTPLIKTFKARYQTWIHFVIFDETLLTCFCDMQVLCVFVKYVSQIRRLMQTPQNCCSQEFGAASYCQPYRMTLCLPDHPRSTTRNHRTTNTQASLRTHNQNSSL